MQVRLLNAQGEAIEALGDCDCIEKVVALQKAHNALAKNLQEESGIVTLLWGFLDVFD